MTILGNTTLVDYGIQNEQSDLRAHVCVKAQRIYVYPTRSALAAIATGRYYKAPVHTQSIQTAEGYLVPPDDITGCVSWRVPTGWFHAFPPDKKALTTTEKGDRALQVVRYAVRRGAFSLPADPEIVTGVQEQIKGTDLFVSIPRMHIQVKCDWDGGHLKHGGTGNLFIQVSECNPFQRH